MFFHFSKNCSSQRMSLQYNATRNGQMSSKSHKLACAPIEDSDQPRGQTYFNIALVLQDESLTIFTSPTNTCTCPLMHM